MSDLDDFIEEFRRDEQSDEIYREIEELNRSSPETVPVREYIRRVLLRNEWRIRCLK